MAAEGLIVLQSPDTMFETRPNAKFNRGCVWPGGEDSRARIFVSLARRECSGISMRELARAAKANLGAVSPQFRGKRTLRHETIQRFIDDIGLVFGPIIRQLRKKLVRAAADRKVLGECLENLLLGMLHAALGKRSMRWQMTLLLREFYQPSREFPMTLSDRISQVHDAVGKPVAAALHRDPQDQAIPLGAQALIGQIMSFGACRSVRCARPDWDDYPRGRIDLIADTLLPATSGSLGLPPGALGVERTLA